MSGRLEKVCGSSFAEMLGSTREDVKIACDTEFQGVDMLTAQFAVRIGDDIVVQIYRSQAVPEPPAGFSLRRVQRHVRKVCKRVIWRPIRMLSRSLSPICVVRDLFSLKGVNPVSLFQGLSLENIREKGRPLRVAFVAHFFTADFFRVLGQDFLAELMRARSEQGARLFIRSDKLLASSVRLSQTGRRLRNGTIGKPSIGKLKKLLSQGGGETLSMNGISRFGAQTGETHGGLLFSRSPDRLFHVAPGQFMDVDLSGCYGAIIGTLNLYAGRPVVHEPGTRRMTVKEAIAFVRKHAAGDDGWIIKVSGDINAFPNALIPSTRDALTNANYQLRRAKSRARRRAYGFGFDSVQNSSQARSGAVIYTRRIEAGIVAWSTWLMIKALPSAWRREYENLEVDTILFYRSCLPLLYLTR